MVRGVFGRTPVAFPNLLLPAVADRGTGALRGERAHRRGPAPRRRLPRHRREAATRAPAARAARSGERRPDRLAGRIRPYAYGLGFHAYLADRFGATRLADWPTRRPGCRPSRARRPSTRLREPLGALWRDYTHRVETGPRPLSGSPRRAPPDPSRSHRARARALPRRPCADCPADIIYTFRNPADFPSLRGHRHRRPRVAAARDALSRVDGIGDQRPRSCSTSRRSDGTPVSTAISTCSTAAAAREALTREARLQDPDLSPDGTIDRLRARGQRRTATWCCCRWRIGASARWSRWCPIPAPSSTLRAGLPTAGPSSRRGIAPARYRRSSSSIRRPARSASSPPATSARIVTPAWRPDGRAVVAAADFNGDTVQSLRVRRRRERRGAPATDRDERRRPVARTYHPTAKPSSLSATPSTDTTSSPRPTASGRQSEHCDRSRTGMCRAAATPTAPGRR